MDIGWPADAGGKWIARVGNRSSEPLPLDEVKRVSADMLNEPPGASRSTALLA